jgi:hypothetical protein
LVSSDGAATATSWFVIIVCPSRQAGPLSVSGQTSYTGDLTVPLSGGSDFLTVTVAGAGRDERIAGITDVACRAAGRWQIVEAPFLMATSV